MIMMKDKNIQKKESVQVNNNHSTELPNLFLELSDNISDLEISKIKLGSQGWNMEECVKGMEYLLHKVEVLKNESSNICKSKH